ncbi:MAG TPA: DUF5313 family protein [Blastococcus sp.]|nr:DUF5313 family protein [Blastococcus sp.]
MSVVDEENPAAMTGPAAEPGTPAEPIVRPAPQRWLWYAFGGRLPERHRGWVLRDTTTRTWWLRHVVRMLVQLAVPLALIMLFLPASWGLRAACAGGGLALALFYSVAYMPEVTENRVVKAGYPAGTATQHRERAGLLHQQRESERKQAAAARRAARYRDRMGR